MFGEKRSQCAVVFFPEEEPALPPAHPNMAVQEGDYVTAGITAVGAAIPFVSGRAASEGLEFIAKHGDDIGDFFQHADDLPAFPCGIGHSFSADTVVATPDGLIPISQLAVGDEVLAYDEPMGENEYQTIEATWVHLDPLIVHLTIEGETIETTPNHPFYTDAGWVEAGDLWVGAAIYTAAGNYGYVQTTELAPHPQPMYDLTVATAHTYFVGDGQWLVHNCDFLVTPNGEAVIVPSGASGPNLAQNGKGVVFSGGNGGNGLAPQVSGVRVMDPTPPKGPSPGYPNGYVSYFNETNQTVNPYTGKPISPKDPWWHIPLNGPQ